MNARESDADKSYCSDLVQQHLHDHYLAHLLVEDSIRADINVLYAFHVESTNITMATGEPLPRQMKLQWWREVLQGERKAEAKGNPVARSLLQVIDQHKLPIAALMAKLDAHEFDLFNDPMADKAMLEGYLGETRSTLFQLSAMVAGTKTDKTLADSSGHAGVSAGIIALLQNLHRSRHSQQIYFPANLLEATGLDAQRYFGELGEPHFHLIDGMISLAEEHFALAMENVNELPKRSHKTFGSLALIPLYLRQMKKQRQGLYEHPVSVSQFRKQWAIFRF